MTDLKYLEEGGVTVIPESLEIQEAPEEIENEEDNTNEDNANSKDTTEKEAGTMIVKDKLLGSFSIDCLNRYF